MTSQFIKAIRDITGGDPSPEKIIPGTMVRFATSDRHGDESGWAKLFTDGEGGVFGCWRQGISETWQAHQPATAEERAAFSEKVKQARKEAEQKLSRARERAASLAAKVWQASAPPVGSKYWTRKQVAPPDTIREIPIEKLIQIIGYHPAAKKEPFADGMVQIIPVRGDKGITTVEMIDETGLKAGLADGQKKGCFWATGRLPEPGDSQPLFLLGEGVATVLSGVMAKPGSIGVAALSCGNLKNVAVWLRQHYPDSSIVTLADVGHGEKAARDAALAVGGLLVKPQLPEDSTGSDINDVHCECGLNEARRQIEAAKEPIPEPAPAGENTPQELSRIRAVDVLEFMRLQFPPRENILAPWLPTQGLAMVYAPRGIGKTHFSLGVSYAVASAGSFLGWQVSTARGVLFLDGEMPAGVLQERIARISVSNDLEPTAPFRIITPDMQPSGMIDISTPEDQRALKPYLDGIELIIVDNLSTLCRHGKEGEGESWLPVQSWALQQRAAGRSVLFIHHAGKNGEQRGTSRREDVLDTVIALKRPGDYTPDKGACFEVHFEKARGIYGDDTKPFEAQLITTPDNRQTWTLKSLEESTAEKVAKLLNEGVPQSEIAELVGISKGSVSKAKKRAQEAGLLVVHIP